MEPNAQQTAVFNFAKKKTGNLQLSARAGTGKTTTLMEVLRYLDGATWFCAFNKAIVSEIDYKVKARTDIEEGSVRVSTVHSAGMKAWGKHIAPKRCDVKSMKIRKLIDEKVDDNEEVFVKSGGIINKLVNLAKSAGFGVLCRIGSREAWDELIEHFGLDMETGLEAGSHKDWGSIIDASIRVYKRSLDLCLDGEIDFSDMLLAPLYYKAKFPKYDNVLIDEDQDISPLRLKVILSCVKPGGRVIGVGDPYQAIYGFTGADSNAIETFKAETNASELPLTVTYRCPKVIVELAKTWVPDIEAHKDAPEGLHITVDLKPNQQGPAVQGLNFWDCAPYSASDVVLCRNTKPLVELAYQFLRKRLPCMIEGRDIGQGLITLATRWKSVKTLNDLEIKLNEWMEAELLKFRTMKQDYKAEALEDQVETLLVLVNAARDEGGDTVQDVADLINRMFGDTMDGERPKCITFSTVHKSKGREWPRVFLLGRDQFMPSKFARKDWEQQQERNLMYVAVTRTQKELIEVNVPPKASRPK